MISWLANPRFTAVEAAGFIWGSRAWAAYGPWWGVLTFVVMCALSDVIKAAARPS